MKKIKVLYISNQNPYDNVGGSIGAQRTYLPLISLQQKNIIDLNAVILCENNFNDTNISNNITFIKKRKYDQYITRLHGFSNTLELYYKKIYKIFLEFNPSIIIFESSRLGKIQEYLSSKSKKLGKSIFIINSFDNFELEYAKVFVKNKIPKILWKKEFNVVEKSERKQIKYSNYNLFLTKIERDKINKYYSVNTDSSIIPIYYNDPLTKNDKKIYNNDNTLKIIFTGSLDYAPNVEASLFLLTQINWIKKNIDSNIQIIIAGKNPNDILKNQVHNNKNVKLIPNPSKEKMKNILLSSDLYISPVFNGSGMKTKIAEALQHGLPIISSKHSLIGYDFLNKYINDVIFPFEDLNIQSFRNSFMLQKEKIINNNNFNYIRNIYTSNFSIDNIEKKLLSIIKFGYNSINNEV